MLLIAHRAANELSLIRPAVDDGANLVEADLHLRRGRLEVRHAKSMGPLPWLWEPWYLVRRGSLHLPDIVQQMPQHAQLMLDLKGWQPWLGRRVRDEMMRVAPDVPYVVCSRHWSVLNAFTGLPHVRTAHSVRTSTELARLDARLALHDTWGVSIHVDLLTPARVSWLRQRADVVMTWPIDDRQSFDRVAELGVNAVISNGLAALQRP